jgi:hypothetical protein
VAEIKAARITTLEVRNPQEARARMFELLRALVRNIARERPLVLAVDDLQWADADSLALLGELLRPPDAPPLLFLATIRSGTERRKKGEEPLLPGDVRQVNLTPLPKAEAHELIRSLLGAETLNEEQTREAEAIYREANGHPLFIDELVRHRAIQRSAASPSRLDDALWDRAAQLSPSARKLLELVAVAGVPLPQQVVAQAAALDFGQVFDSVGALRAAHFVRTSGVYRRDTVEPYHDRVRESVLRHLDDPTRKDWHGRLALALEQTGEVDPEKVMAHWLGAGNPTRAAEYALRAADAAAEALAFDHAASLYRIALEHGPAQGRDALKEKLAEALTNAGRGAQAARVYLEAAGDGTSNRALDLRRRAAEELVCSGQMDEGNAVSDRVLVAIHVKAPHTPFGAFLSIIYLSLVLAIRGIKFKSRTEREIEARDLLRVDCLCSAGCGLGMMDHIRGTEMQLRAFLEALRVGEPSRIARTMAYFAAGRASAGAPAFARTMELQARVDAMAEELRQPFLKAMASLVAGYAYHLSGRFRDARTQLELAETIIRDQCVGASYEGSACRTFLYRALVHLGDLQELAKRVEATLRDAEQKGDLYTLINLRTNGTPFLALVRDDPDAAEAEIARAEKHLSTKGFHVPHSFALLSRSYVGLYRGDAKGVLAHMNARWKAVKRSLLLRVQTLRIGLAEVRGRACVSLAAIDGPDAAAMRREAESHIRTLDREQLPWATALATILRAGLSNVAGDRDTALAQLALADESLGALGLRLAQAIVQRRRGVLLGGSEGQALVREGERYLLDQGVKNIARMSALYAPGFKEP